jgi:hypothetical protein
MEMPTLPTDNLYKFMAIAGLLLLAGTMYFPTVLQIQLTDQEIQNKETAQILAADVEYTHSKIDEINKIIDNSILEREGKFVAKTNRLNLSYSESEIKQLYNEILGLYHQIKINSAKLDASSSRTDELELWIGLARKAQYFFLFSSVVLTFNGFRLWYNRIQKYADKEIENLARRKQKDSS